MAKNELLPFANGEDANVLPTNQWEALTDILENGFQSGIARSEQVNRVLAQGAVASYVLGQLIVDQLNKDAKLDKDTLYQNLILALQENAKDVCLPLSGGTMTGSIGLAGGKAVYGTDTSSFVELKSGQNSTDGGRVTVIGKGHESAGQVWVTAHDGTNSSTLIASPSGGLKWANKNVVRSVNGTTADASGNVTISVPATPKAYVTETWVSGMSWYRKWSDGWIEQGGLVSDTENWTNRTKTITLHKAFSNTKYNITLGDVMRSADSYMGEGNTGVKSVSTSKFVVWLDDMTGGFYWHACGY